MASTLTSRVRTGTGRLRIDIRIGKSAMNAVQILRNPDPKYINLLQLMLDNEQRQRMLANEPDLGITELAYRGDAEYFVAVEHDTPLGIATVTQWFDGSVELYKLYVAPTSRIHGIGMQLVNHAISVFTSRNIKEFLIEIVGDSAVFWQRVATGRQIKEYGDGKYGISIA